MPTPRNDRVSLGDDPATGAGGVPGGLHASPVANRDLGSTVVGDIDATLVETHSIKEQTAANFKGGFGYRPLGA